MLDSVFKRSLSFKWATRKMGSAFKAFLSDLGQTAGIVPPDQSVRLLYHWYCEQMSGREDAPEEKSPRLDPERIEEIIRIVSPVASDFFIEPERFGYLVQSILPIQYMTKGPYRAVNFLSAGCGTGEEAYTLGVIAELFAEDMESPFSYKVVGADICSACLETAKAGIYPEEKWLTVPLRYRKKYFMRSKDRGRKVFRVCQEIRDNVEFRPMDLVGDYDLQERFDVIMCGNVFGYLSSNKAASVISKLAGYLAHGGVMVFGEKEAVPFGKNSMVKLAPGIYRPKTD